MVRAMLFIIGVVTEAVVLLVVAWLAISAREHPAGAVVVLGERG
jgi:hypothetical protein